MIDDVCSTSSISSSNDDEDYQQHVQSFEPDCFEALTDQPSPIASSPAPLPIASSPAPLPISDQNEECTSSASNNEKDSESSSQGTGLSPVLYLISFLLIKLQVKYKLSDSVMTTLISILQLIFSLTSHPLQHCFPKSLHNLNMIASVNQLPEYKKFVVCPDPKCCKLYEETLLQEASSIPLCEKQMYNSRCAKQLGYEKFLSFGKIRLMPYKTFVYLSPIVWLKKFYNIEAFKWLLQIQQNYSSDSRYINDVWDGRIWKSFKDHDNWFFQDIHNVAFIMNVDWFKPYKRSEYKIGGIYLNILNLPRTERYKTKWTMLIGLIPGPTEPKENINSFLQPLVNDLIELWNGIQIGSDTTIRAALIAVSCDIPAARKVCQFLSHKANKGCSRCEFEALRENPRDVTSRMSYFTTSVLVPRLNDTVRAQADEFKDARNKTEAREIQKKNGIRWSELLRLTYFDIVSMTMVDPMHTVFLGMIRHETELIFQDPLFCKESQRVFSSRMKNLRVPYDVGRLPNSLGEKLEFSTLTADQWKNFALIYAIPCFWELLPPESYESICLLSEIVQIIVQPALTNADISRLDYLIKAHHQCFERNYGRFEVSINYHMALHIPDMIKDFGPPHSFWCFSFERMNGVLSGLPNSNHHIELELLTKFLKDADIESVSPPNPLVTSWPHLDDILPVERELESLAVHPLLLNFKVKSMFATYTQDSFDLQQSIDKGDTAMLGFDWKVEYLPPSRFDVQITRDFYLKLLHFYENLYEGCSIALLPRIDKHARCSVNGLTLSSDLHGSDRSSIVKAFFAVIDSEPCPYFGIVRFFFKSTIIITDHVNHSDHTKSHDLAYVQWFKFYCDFPDPLFQVRDEFYEGDEILSPRRFVSRCALLKAYSNNPYQLVVELPV